MALARTLGLPALTFYGVGIILGAGIYSVLGAAAQLADGALWWSFAICGGVALLTALSYAELASASPKASAEFTYLRRALPRWPAVGLVTGLLVALSGAATAATVAMAFAGYLGALVDTPSAPVAWGLLAAATLLNVAGVKQASWVNAAFTLVEAGGLVLFIALGATSSRLGAAFASAPTIAVLPAAALVFFSFLGFENIANLAEESREPERDLPRAMFLSLAIATVLYVLVAVAALALASPDDLAASEAPLADAARSHSSWIAGALGGIALFATANTALVSLLVAARVVFGIAREGELPAGLAATLPRRKSPWAATLVVAGVAVALVPFGSVGLVASISSFASLLAFASVNVALIVLRRREPDLERPFRVPGSIRGVPVLTVLAAITTLGIATQLDRTALLGGAGAAAAFTAYALWHGRQTGIPRAGRRGKLAP
jgi:APA family basic amino acid/polyamine antiporter